MFRHSREGPEPVSGLSLFRRAQLPRLRRSICSPGTGRPSALSRSRPGSGPPHDKCRGGAPPAGRPASTGTVSGAPPALRLAAPRRTHLRDAHPVHGAAAPRRKGCRVQRAVRSRDVRRSPATKTPGRLDQRPALDQTLPGELPDALVAAVRTVVERHALDAALDELEWQRWLSSEARGYSFVARIVREVVAQDMLTPGQRRRIQEAVGRQ